MDVVLSAAVAVAGTLMGCLLTHVLQARAAERQAKFLRRERMRNELLVAFHSLAEALHNLRRAEHDRWSHERGSKAEEVTTAARERAVQLRPAAWAALAHLQLLVEDLELLEAARTAYQLTRSLHGAHDVGDLTARDEAVRTAIDVYLGRAAAHLK